MTTDFKELLLENTKLIEKELEYYINLNQNELSKIMSYSLLSGGKRIRPFIVLETYKLFANDIDIKKALPFAVAIEMIQAYSLVHDDLPCMDNDDFRRGIPTCHKVYGEDKALLAGDSLLTYAFEVLGSNNYVSDRSVRLAVTALAKYSGYIGMAGGQMIDLNSKININSYDDLKNMHTLKTAALIKASANLGYFASTDTPNKEIIDDLEKFSENIGVAFQIRDDILDKTSSSEQLGKPTGSDERNLKTTSLTYMTVKEAENEVEKLTNEAISIIEKYYKGKSGLHSLTELAKYMINRTK